MSNEVTVYDGGRSLAIEREPDVVLEEAGRAARALKHVLDQKPDKVMMGGSQYLEFEDWQTVARFYGLTAKEDGDPEYIQLGDVAGFKASAVALDRNGDIVSRATALCMRDEEKWNERTTFAWGYVCKDGSWSADDPGTDQMVWEPNPAKPGKNRPKKERRQTGSETVPLYQLASMAQTRACAKVLRNVLSWVAVLAGYRPTPAEELPAAGVSGRTPGEDAIDGEYTEKPAPTRKPAPAAPGATAQPASGRPLAMVTSKSDPWLARWQALVHEAGEAGVPQSDIPQIIIPISQEEITAKAEQLKAAIAAAARRERAREQADGQGDLVWATDEQIAEIKLKAEPSATGDVPWNDLTYQMAAEWLATL